MSTLDAQVKQAQQDAKAALAKNFTVPTITVKQADFICKLAGERPLDTLSPAHKILAEVIRDNEHDWNKITKQNASELITKLLAVKPVVPANPTAHPITVNLNELPKVKFALIHKETGNVTFFQVCEGKTSKQRYIMILKGAPGDWNRKGLSPALQQAAARAFMGNMKGAMDTYADNFTVCAKCDAPLSDERSRVARLGPVCAKNLGYAW